MNIPFMDLKGPFKDIRNEIIGKITELIDNTQFIGGEEIERFEKEFAAFQNVKHASACSNGTDALILALKALNIGPGDKVLIPANTFIATAEAVMACGADIDFIDVEPDYYTLSPELLEVYMKSEKAHNVKCVIPVHLYGQMADMNAICSIAERYNLYVIEDAAQAHGADIEGKRAGSFGDIATFSFYPGKNLGAFGDAGALITNNSDLHSYISMLIDHGRNGQKYVHEIPGYNKRMDTIQAAVLRIKLKYLNNWNHARIEKAEYYIKELDGIGDVPKSKAAYRHVYHIFAYHIKKRDKLMVFLKDKGISAGIHYPIPLHMQPAFSQLNYREGDFPVSEFNSRNEISLPLWPEISEEQLNYVIKTLRSYQEQ